MPDHLDPLAEPGSPLPRPAPPRTWRDRAQHLADATGTTPARLLAGGVALAAAGAVVVVATRPSPPPPEVTLPFATTSAVAPTTTTLPEPVEVVVHVAGAVARPGVHRLAADARVVDAVDAAGGLTSSADGARLNLAAPLADGERVYVPAVGEEIPPVPAGPSGPDPGRAVTGGAGLVDLNRADEAALDALPGIGPATAAAIIEHRERIGAFTSVDQLLDVRGIGEAKLEQLRPLVTV